MLFIVVMIRGIPSPLILENNTFWLVYCGMLRDTHTLIMRHKYMSVFVVDVTVELPQAHLG